MPSTNTAPVELEDVLAEVAEKFNIVIAKAADGSWGYKIDEQAESTQAIIAVGNAVDGLTFIGPFPDHEAAVEYAEGLLSKDWVIAKLDEPQES